MTVELAFRFPLGRVHATPWGENQNQGGVEFPPSPWRLLRALYATWRSRAEELDERLVLELLDQLADPPTFVVPRHALAHTRHYLPGPAHKQGFATDKAKVLDAFVSVAPSDELIIRWDIDLDQPSRDALTTLAERLTYLGRAESICDVSARFEADSSAEHALRQLNDEDTTPSIALLAPHRPVDEASLTVTTTHVRTVLKLREPPATHWLRYPRPVPGPEVQVRNRVAPEVRSVTAIRWSIASGARPSKYEAVAWADALRHAVFSQYGGKDKRQPPSALSGKFSDGSRTNTQHKHVHWLAFGDQNDRRLSTLVAWAPGGFPNADGHSVDEEILDAMANVRFLRSRFIRSTSVGVEGWGRAEDVVPEIAKASHHWVSATPFAPSRHPRKNSGSGVKSFEVAVAQELTWRGHGDNLPSVTFDESGDWHHFRRHRPNRERLNQARRVVGLRLEFPEPFAGPLALGALSHFGLGLFMPIEDSTTLGGVAMSEVIEIPDLVPARMLNEFTYCKRLFFLEWVNAQFADNTDTVEGRWKHRVVDKPGGAVPLPDEGDVKVARSLMLSSTTLGLVAKLDLLEGAPDGTVVPVDTKRGSAPDIPEGAWEADRVQICVQGLLLREAGYACDHGELYYAESRDRVIVEFDNELVEYTLAQLHELRSVAVSDVPPPPLIDSPKCPRCSLVGICLPDEVNTLAARSAMPPRRLIPRDIDPQPLYVMEQGAWLSKDRGRITVTKNKEPVTSMRLLDVSQLNLYGNVQVSSQLFRELFARDIPVCWFSYGGWFSGMATGLPGKNVELRRRQVVTAGLGGLAIARNVIRAKIRNSRTLLRRNSRERDEGVLDQLKVLADKAGTVDSAASLLGVEGAAARTYFGAFPTMLREDKRLPGETFSFEGRNRRPPLDPVNCLLSYVYGLLTKELTVALFVVGFDPFLGFYHRPRFGRPALALDLAEEYRPLIAESVVINLINNGEVNASDFAVRAGGVTLTQSGRKAVLAAYERRLAQELTHPVFGYKITYRRVLEVQARLLAAHVLGELPEYTPVTTR